jgi:hypothetical protein
MSLSLHLIFWDLKNLNCYKVLVNLSRLLQHFYVTESCILKSEVYISELVNVVIYENFCLLNFYTLDLETPKFILEEEIKKSLSSIISCPVCLAF